MNSSRKNFQDSTSMISNKNTFEKSVFRFGENLETIVQKPENPQFLMLETQFLPAARFARRKKGFFPEKNSKNQIPGPQK